MEQEYNWKLITGASLPIAILNIWILFTQLSNSWKNTLLIFSLAVAGAIVYSRDKKKGNVFTAVGLVLFIVLIFKLLKESGIF